jgi:3-deoxy-7-phosphoheptulonate synthase
MYNYELLKALNETKKPVILKRAFSATIKEWVNATEYLSDLGEENIFLCERGIRTFENAYRNTLDLNAVTYLKQNTSFKVLVDPSHGTGNSAMVLPLARAAMMAGCDGLLVEVHPTPTQALSDADQGISIEKGIELFHQTQKLLQLRESFHA